MKNPRIPTGGLFLRHEWMAGRRPATPWQRLNYRLFMVQWRVIGIVLGLAVFLAGWAAFAVAVLVHVFRRCP